MDDVISLSGPVELVGGELVLLIPLEAGGEALSIVARGISRIEGDYLRVTIPQWLAEKLCIAEGSEVNVNNAGGTFNITPEALDE
jgi:hypothetical protein